MKTGIYVLFYLIIGIFIFGCTSLHTRQAVCNLLKSKVIFNGGTANRREAQIQNAEKPLAEHTYDVHCE